MIVARDDDETEREKRLNQRNMEQMRRELDAAQAELSELRAGNRNETEQLRRELEAVRSEAADLRQQREARSGDIHRGDVNINRRDERRNNDRRDWYMEHRVQYKDLEGIIPKFSGNDKTLPVEKWI